MTPALFFDDLAALPGRGGLNILSPLADMRSTFDIRTGALTTLERFRRAMGLNLVALRPRAEMAELCRAVHGNLAGSTLPQAGGPVLMINGRCPLPLAEIRSLTPGEILVESMTGAAIAAYAPPAELSAILEGRTASRLVKQFAGRALLSRPWHVKSFRDRALDMDLQLLGSEPSSNPPPPSLVFGEGRLKIHPTAKIYPGVTFDLEHGSIVIDEAATIRPGASLHGPVYVGSHVTILDKATIKAHTAIGPHCKIAGEVGGTIIQGYSNKAHDGHLGDSWLGEWVNLGAGTTNSNLLNTYGRVPARQFADDDPQDSGETFLGAVIGDHAKAGICTRIMTGAVIHTGAMYAATAPVARAIEPFRWVTDADTKPYRLDKFMEVARAMMARRKVTPDEAYVARLSALHTAAQ